MDGDPLGAEGALEPVDRRVRVAEGDAWEDGLWHAPHATRSRHTRLERTGTALSRRQRATPSAARRRARRTRARDAPGRRSRSPRPPAPAARCRAAVSPARSGSAARRVFGGAPMSAANRFTRWRREQPSSAASSSTRMRPPLRSSSVQARHVSGRTVSRAPASSRRSTSSRIAKRPAASPASCKPLRDQRGLAPQQLLQPHRPARQLPGRHAEQRPRRERLEVDLDPGSAALVAHAHRPRVDAAGERPEPLALDGPARVEVDDHDDLRVRRLARLGRRPGAGAEVRVAAHEARELRMGSPAYQVHMPSIPRLPPLLDTALDRTLLGYGNLGYLARRPGWPDEPLALDGKVAVVTGAKSGLGRATAKGLAELGATVRMAVRGREDGERVEGGARGRGAGRAAGRRRARRQLARGRPRLRRGLRGSAWTCSSTTRA